MRVYDEKQGEFSFIFNSCCGGNVKIKKPNFGKLKKYLRISAFVAVFGVVGVAYQNCSQPSTGFEDMSSMKLSALSSEDDLFNMLQEARELSALLRTFDLNADKASDILKQAPSVALQLGAQADMIEKAIVVDKVPTNSNVVLKEVDTLVNLLSKARDVRVTYDSIRRDTLLSLRIDQVEANLDRAVQELAALGGAFNQFKNAIVARVDGLVAQMKVWENRVDIIDQTIADLAAKSEAEDLALKAALNSLKSYTENELAGVKDRSQQLQDSIDQQAKDHAKLVEELRLAQEEMSRLGDISGRMCSYDSNGNIADARIKCTSSSQNNCCLTVEVINCSELFAGSPAALNQCGILLTVIKNHDQQLQAIKAVDERQNEAIGSLTASVDRIIGDISVINNNVLNLANGVDKIKAVTDELVNQVGSIKDTIKKNDEAVKARLADLDTRTLLLEFKANRSEVIHGLQARANATLAWSTMRYAHINDAFCVNRRNQALAMFDYKVARQNWEYCLEKRAIVTLAQSMASVANSYAGMLGALNVDTDCTAQINGKPASSLTNSELMNDAILQEVNNKCTSGGQVVARALMLNIVRYLKQVGPDHRTYESMSSASKAVNIAFFGTDWVQVSEQQRKEFNEIDPTSDLLKDTPYGKVERLFVYNYYATAFRDANGKFITDPNKVNANVSGSIFTEQQILAGNQVGKNLADFVKRVRSLEAEGYCTDCGFKVGGRNNPDSNKSTLVITHGAGKSRFFFPNDPKTDMCPVDDNVVIRHNDGKHYIYHVKFDTYGNDILTPHLTQGLHTVIANSDSDLNAGNFNYCHYDKDVKIERAGLDMASIPSRWTIRATRPYAQSYGRPLCTKLTAVCAVRNGEWQAPASVGSMTVADLNNPATQNVLTRYLSGFPVAVVGAMCSVQTPAVGAPAPVYQATRNIASVDTARGLRHAWSNPAGNNASARAQGYIIQDSTQLLGSSYWPLQDGALPYTGERIMLSQSKPFAAEASSAVLTSTKYVREVDTMSSLTVQECSHCPANLKMLGGCSVAAPQ